MDLKKINHLGQKINKLTKIVSDVNALDQMTKGNITPLKRKAKNKVKNFIWKKIF